MAECTVYLPSLGSDAPDRARVSFVYKEEPGETLAKEENLIEMVTDKATFNVPCPYDGVLVKMLVTEDDELEVGQAICVMDVP